MCECLCEKHMNLYVCEMWCEKDVPVKTRSCALGETEGANHFSLLGGFDQLKDVVSDCICLANSHSVLCLMTHLCNEGTLTFTKLL